MHVQKEHAASVFDHESLQVARSRFQLLQQGQYVSFSFATLVNLDLCFDSLPGRIESLVVERFQQVVDRMHFKSAHRILIVSSDEDDVRSLLPLERRQYLEAAELGHLYIQ